MKRTEWFPISINPVYEGMYEVTNVPDKWSKDREGPFQYYFYTAPIRKWEEALYHYDNRINTKPLFAYWRGLEKEGPKKEVFTPQMREHTLQIRIQRMRAAVEDAIKALKNQLSEDEIMKKQYP